MVGAEFGKSWTDTDTAGMRGRGGGFCRSGLEQQEEEEEKLFGRSLASAVALKQTSGF